MRREMRQKLSEDQIQEVTQQKLSERRQAGDQLFEKWSKKKNLGEGLDTLYKKNEKKAHNLSFVLENQEKHLKSLTETQISNAFSTAPLNVMKIIRLAYPNSIRGDIFTELTTA